MYKNVFCSCSCYLNEPNKQKTKNTTHDPSLSLLFTNKGAQQAAFEGYNDCNDLIATFYGACKTLNVHTKSVYARNLHIKTYIFNYVSGSLNTINNTRLVKNTLDDLVRAWE